MITRRILVKACFLVLVLGANAALPAAPPWEIACGDGRVDTILENFDSAWTFCCTADAVIPAPTLSIVPGCNGDAMAVDYDLTNVAPSGSANAGQSWIVLQKFFSPDRDLTPYTHIRLAMRDSNLNSHDNIEVKLKDASGLFSTVLRSMTDLSAWRAIYLDFREFTGTGAIDLAHISGLEIAIVRCAGCEVVDDPSNAGPSEEHVGTLYLDEFAAVDLKSGAANRLTETGFDRDAADLLAAKPEQRNVPRGVPRRGGPLVRRSVDAVEHNDGRRLADGMGVLRSQRRSPSRSAPTDAALVG